MTEKKIENVHVPVLLTECLEHLAPAILSQENPVMVDGTLGGGGHTVEFLKHFDKLKIIGCDYDLNAIDAVKKRETKFVTERRLEFFHGNFSKLETKTPWDAVLVDLGYSSNQLADETYGMSFIAHGAAPLDMRLSRPPEGASAWDLINESSESDLADILYAYAEERDSRRISRKIKEALSSGEITNSTKSFADFLERIDRTPKSKRKTHPATTIFQALRIAVNDELRNLDELLNNATLILKKSGRIGIITFHSLEDRIVKRWGQANAQNFRAVTKKPIEASDDEVAKNPRSRSAKLRVYERV